jgi:hypothetical protein
MSVNSNGGMIPRQGKTPNSFTGALRKCYQLPSSSEQKKHGEEKAEFCLRSISFHSRTVL